MVCLELKLLFTQFGRMFFACLLEQWFLFRWHWTSLHPVRRWSVSQNRTCWMLFRMHACGLYDRKTYRLNIRWNYRIRARGLAFVRTCIVVHFNMHFIIPLVSEIIFLAKVLGIFEKDGTYIEVLIELLTSADNFKCIWVGHRPLPLLLRNFDKFYFWKLAK